VVRKPRRRRGPRPKSCHKPASRIKRKITAPASSHRLAGELGQICRKKGTVEPSGFPNHKVFRTFTVSRRQESFKEMSKSPFDFETICNLQFEKKSPPTWLNRED
jgi:hypothetical protein